MLKTPTLLPDTSRRWTAPLIGTADIRTIRSEHVALARLAANVCGVLVEELTEARVEIAANKILALQDRLKQRGDVESLKLMGWGD